MFKGSARKQPVDTLRRSTREFCIESCGYCKIFGAASAQFRTNGRVAETHRRGFHEDEIRKGFTNGFVLIFRPVTWLRLFQKRNRMWSSEAERVSRGAAKWERRRRENLMTKPEKHLEKILLFTNSYKRPRLFRINCSTQKADFMSKFIGRYFKALGVKNAVISLIK